MVNPDEYFYASDGTVLKDKLDLLDFLRVVDPKTFNHHVTSEKNDFAAWILGALKDQKLYEKISRTNHIEEMIYCLEQSLKEKKNTMMDKKSIIQRLKEAIIPN